MLLATLFLAALAHSLASPLPAPLPGSTIPSPVCVVAATITASRCDPTRTRTIFDILNSCIGVILLCTYISMHHNIPDQNDSRARVAWLKLRTTLYALIAPEVVIMWAIRQRIMAGRIAEENKHRGWTRTHGFFVQMGGLMQREVQGVETYKVAGADIIVDWGRLKIPHIPEKEIKDHGKGDLLAKAVVVVQTTWFVAQCIARHVEGLVLTEIELVTLAFATLNVITYGLWWDKPLNVEYPIYFDEKGVRTDGPHARDDQQKVNLDGEEAQVGDLRGYVVLSEKRVWYQRIWGRMKDSVAGLCDVCQKNWQGMKRSWRKSVHKRGVIATVARAVVVAPFMTAFRPLWNMMDEEGETNRSTSVHPFYAASMDVKDRFIASLYGSAIGVIFGGIHLIAWDFQFPTTTEFWLWRVSSLVLTITPLNLVLGYTLLIAHEKSDAKLLESIGYILIVPALFLGPPLYFAARIILLFIALFTLRDLPDIAYQNVRWTEFFPHI
ncbi:hypothetical protein AX16_007910 [Volvariella volvacea WC 439]|nr:hypothetical protein AX16_007910 [Volvariella volvacea WC 439]